MSNILNIVTEKELRAYANGELRGGERRAVRSLLQQDEKARQFLDTFSKETKDKKMNIFASNTNAKTPAPVVQSEVVAAELTECLADTFVLMTKTQSVHWNLTGPQFLVIHNLTEEHYNDLFDAVDDLAERIRALGHAAPSGIREMLEASTIDDDDQPTGTREMIQSLAQHHQTVANRCLKAADKANGEFDLVSADMLTRRVEFHQKAVWMLKAQIS